MDNDKIMAQYFSRYMTGFCLSKAILEDYAKVVAKLENISEDEVKQRVNELKETIFKEEKEKLEKMYEERDS